MLLPSLKVPLYKLANTDVPKFFAQWDNRLDGADIQPGMRVLYLGCGLGQLFELCLEATGPDGKVIAVENRPSLVERARSKSAALNITLIESDTSKVDLPDASFDRIILHRRFHDLRDRSGTIRESRRLLKVGGKLWLWEPRLLVKDWHSRSFDGMFRGAQLEPHSHQTTLLGHMRCFVANNTQIGSHFRPPS